MASSINVKACLFSFAFLGLGLSCRSDHFLTFSLNPLQIHSKTAILTHLFSHLDRYHLVTNFYQIALSSVSLNLSFPKSLALFLTAGLTGTLTFIIEKYLFTSQPIIYELFSKSTLERLDDYITLPRNTFTVCGGSGAAYGFMGAEIYVGLKKIFKLRSGKYTPLQKYRVEEDLARLLVVGIVNLVHIGIGIVNGNDGIGHSAHLGGFLAGIGVAYFFL
jgi:membrane associated rhomboid family serine protease